MVTTHFALVAVLLVAATLADSDIVRPLPSNTEASASHAMVSLPRFVEAIVMVKVNTNLPVVGTIVARVATSLSGDGSRGLNVPVCGSKCPRIPGAFGLGLTVWP
jgi:hypothetical protein